MKSFFNVESKGGAKTNTVNQILWKYLGDHHNMSKNEDIAPCLSQMTNWRHFWLCPLLIYICICQKILWKYYFLLCLEIWWVPFRSIKGAIMSFRVSYMFILFHLVCLNYCDVLQLPKYVFPSWICEWMDFHPLWSLQIWAVIHLILY